MLEKNSRKQQILTQTSTSEYLMFLLYKLLEWQIHIRAYTTADHLIDQVIDNTFIDDRVISKCCCAVSMALVQTEISQVSDG